MQLSTESKAMLAAAGAYSIFGLSYLFSKIALNIADTTVLLLVRFSITFLVLNLLVLFRVKKLNLRGKNLLGPIVMGILQPVLYFIFENNGLKQTTTSFTGLISSISPIFATVLGAVLLREKPAWRQWLCIALSIIGVAMVSIGPSAGKNTVVGVLCLLGSHVCGALYSILSRRLGSKFSAFELTYIMFAIGFVFFSGLGVVQYGNNTVSVITAALHNTNFVIAALYLGILSSVVAFLLSNYSLANLPVARASIFNSFATVISVTSGVIIMKDPFTLTSAIAFVLIMAGVAGVNRFAKPALTR